MRKLARFAVAAIALLLVCAGGKADAVSVVLDGVPGYYGETGAEDNATESGLVLSDSVAVLSADAPRPALGGTVLGGAATYLWWYGCSPTSTGMAIAYWDHRAGTTGLYDGDALVWGGDGSSGTKRMVASQAHITAGSENGYTYGDWHNSSSYPNHAAAPECVADFLHTVNGGSYSDCITKGLEAYVEWNGTWGATTYAVKDSYAASVANPEVAYYGGTFDFADLKGEIDAERVVLLDLITYDGGSKNWYGHTVLAYGYQADMFEIRVPTGHGPNGYEDLLCPGYAVKDTWTTGYTSQSSWHNWSGAAVDAIIDENGVEWWPFVEYRGFSYGDVFDWMVTDAITLDIAPNAVPEPASLALFGLATSTLFAARRRRMRSGGR